MGRRGQSGRSSSVPWSHKSAICVILALLPCLSLSHSSRGHEPNSDVNRHRPRRQSEDDACLLLTDTIDPCVCSNSILDCSRVTSEEQLLSIPGIHGAGQAIGFSRITIEGNGFLRSIPEAAFGDHYATFEYAFIDNNQLRSIDASVFSARSGPTLEAIQVYRNDLSSFPFEALQSFSNLRSFVAFGNFLQEVPDSAFDGVSPSLRSILLYNNNITRIGEYAFRGLPGLDTLILERNGLTRLGPRSLHFDAAVASVVFYGNAIAAMDPEVVGDGGVFPPRIVLTDNRLETLPREPWEGILDSLAVRDEQTYVEIAGNPLKCDCDIQWLYARPDLSDYVHYVCEEGLWMWALDSSFFDEC